MITDQTVYEYDDVLEGFRHHRAANLASRTSQHLGGHEERYLRNRALFVSAKSVQVPVTRADPDEENRDQFVGRKVRTA
jgi:hypothetical protein